MSAKTERCIPPCTTLLLTPMQQHEGQLNLVLASARGAASCGARPTLGRDDGNAASLPVDPLNKGGAQVEGNCRQAPSALIEQVEGSLLLLLLLRLRGRRLGRRRRSAALSRRRRCRAAATAAAGEEGLGVVEELLDALRRVELVVLGLEWRPP